MNGMQYEDEGLSFELTPDQWVAVAQGIRHHQYVASTGYQERMAPQLADWIEGQADDCDQPKLRLTFDWDNGATVLSAQRFGLVVR